MTTNVIRITASPAVYTVAEVSQLLSLSRGMTYAMVRSGEIPAKKIGDRWIVPKVRFHEWLNECAGPTLTDPDPDELADADHSALTAAQPPKGTTTR